MRFAPGVFAETTISFIAVFVESPKVVNELNIVFKSLAPVTLEKSMFCVDEN